MSKFALSSWFKVHPDERGPLVWSFLYFFCLLCGYYMLRPVRDEMAIEGGVQHLPWMMTGTFLTLLVTTPLFGWLSSKWRRVPLLFAVYGFFIVHLVLFYIVMTEQWHPEWVARVFFVWLSIFNLFVVSVFWSFMADLFTPEQGTRLFSVIAAGGSLGAISGPILTAGIISVLPIPSLMICSTLWLSACMVCIYRLDRWPRADRLANRSRQEALGGSMWAGIRLAAKSSYLMGICAYLFVLTMSATVLYLEQMAVISRDITVPESRTRLFAGIDLTVNLLTFLTQALVTNRLVLRFGLGPALMFLPAVSALGFLALAVSPLLPVFVLFTVVRRVGEYAISKPAREVLFTVVSREEKYKAKNFIDTTVSRGGDASTGWVMSGIKALGVSATHLALLLIPLMIVWGWIARFLARREALLQHENRHRP